MRKWRYSYVVFARGVLSRNWTQLDSVSSLSSSTASVYSNTWHVINRLLALTNRSSVWCRLTIFLNGAPTAYCNNSVDAPASSATDQFILNWWISRSLIGSMGMIADSASCEWLLRSRVDSTPFVHMMRSKYSRLNKLSLRLVFLNFFLWSDHLLAFICTRLFRQQRLKDILTIDTLWHKIKSQAKYMIISL